MKLLKILFKFIMATLLFVLAGYIGSYAFYDLNSTAADIHVAIGTFLLLGGFFVLSVDL